MEEAWKTLRSEGLTDGIETHIHKQSEGSVTGVTHIRTAHYVVCRVEMVDGSIKVVRVGVNTGEPQELKNTALGGTSTFRPEGQWRENGISSALHELGAPTTKGTITEDHLYEMLWLPYLEDSKEPATAKQWHSALSRVHSADLGSELPVFTNRVKSLERVERADSAEKARSLAMEYDEAMLELFEVTSRWSLVHGDAHAGNILMNNGELVLIDFDTACWAPTVWDVTHLLNRAGRDGNTGYSVGELLNLFEFSMSEVLAATKLRRIAGEIARLVPRS